MTYILYIYKYIFLDKSPCIDITTPLLPTHDPAISNHSKTFIIRLGGGVFNKVSGRDEISTQRKIISFVKCVWFRSSAYKVFNSRARERKKVRRGTPLINGQRKPKEMKQFECCIDMFLLRFIDTCYCKKNKLVTTLVINNNGHTSTTYTCIINLSMGAVTEV